MFLDMDRQPRERLAAVDDSRQRLTFGALSDYCREMGAHIPARSLVFCLCRNCIGSLAGYLGFVESRAVPLLLNEKAPRELLDGLIDCYHPGYLWLPAEREAEFQGRRVFADAFGYVLLETGEPPYALHPDLSLLLTTSGSTGSPKLVRHTYRNIDANSRNVAKFFGFTPDDRGMADLPMQYTMGLSVIQSHLVVGASVMLTNESLMSPAFWKFLKEERCTDFTGVPFSYEVLHKLRFTRMDLPDLVTLAQGGGKMPEEMHRELARYARETGKRFFATFGQTECTARMAYLPPDRAEEKVGSIGIAIPQGELFLADDEGHEIKEMAAEGEMGYRGPNVTMGYAQTPEELALGDLWQGQVFTGDIARRDSEGFYYIVGRKKRFLKLYGYRVSLDQAERMVTGAFDCECACGGNDVRMEIFVTDGSAAGKIPGYLASQLKMPAAAFHVNVLAEIPRNEFGKIQYRKLAEL